MQHQILCNCCSDVAFTHESSFDSLDGWVTPCDSCGVLGRVSVDADEDGAYARFYELRESELHMLENTTLVAGYQTSQKVIDDLMHRIDKLEREKQSLINELHNNRSDLQRLIDKVDACLI